LLEEITPVDVLFHPSIKWKKMNSRKTVVMPRANLPLLRRAEERAGERRCVSRAGVQMC
jgi:hypothetical protein